MDSEMIELHTRDSLGRLVELTVDLDQAAAIERGREPVVIGRRIRRTRSWELAAAVALAKDRLADVDEQLAAVVDQLDADWLRRLGIEGGG